MRKTPKKSRIFFWEAPLPKRWPLPRTAWQLHILWPAACEARGSNRPCYCVLERPGANCAKEWWPTATLQMLNGLMSWDSIDINWLKFCWIDINCCWFETIFACLDSWPGWEWRVCRLVLHQVVVSRSLLKDQEDHFLRSATLKYIHQIQIQIHM